MRDIDSDSGKIKFCCSNMEAECDIWTKDSLAFADDKTIVYDPVERMFAYFINKGLTLEESSMQTMDYCPFCGTKLPKLLCDEYISELQKSMSRQVYESLFFKDLESQCWCLDRNKIPEEFKEFKTDEWWIKRGL